MQYLITTLLTISLYFAVLILLGVNFEAAHDRCIKQATTGYEFGQCR